MISIIIPVYNAEASLCRCLDSVLNQTLNEREIICVNDGSKDGSLSILRSYAEKHPEIQVIDKANGGVSSARNTGLRVAKGEYIAFLDSDDYYAEQTYLSDMLSCIGDPGEIDLVIAGYTVISDAEPAFVRAGGASPVSAAELALDYWSYTDVINSPCNKLFKRALIAEEFNEKMTFGEDAVFVFSYLCGCRSIAFCNNVGYAYTFFNSSTTKNFREKQLYHAEQTNAYHSAILRFWSDVLPSDTVFAYYVRLRANGIFQIMRKVLRIKGVRAFLKEDFGALYCDPYLNEHKKEIFQRSASDDHCRIAEMLIKKNTLRLKLFVMRSLLKSKLLKREKNKTGDK